MSSTGLSLFVFGIFIIVVDGMGLLLIPNTVLRLFRIPETKEVWVRILGFIIALLGAYYVVAGLYEQTAFAWASVFGRFAVLLFLVIMTLIRQTKATIILFGVADAAGAIWTLAALLGR